MKNVGPSEPKMMSLSCGEWYCKKFVGNVSGLEKYEWVGWKVCMRLSNIGCGSIWWCGQYLGVERVSSPPSTVLIRLM